MVPVNDSETEQGAFVALQNGAVLNIVGSEVGRDDAADSVDELGKPARITQHL